MIMWIHTITIYTNTININVNIILYYSILIDSHCQLQNSNNSFYFQKYELAHFSNIKQLQSSLEVVLGTIK